MQVIRPAAINSGNLTSNIPELPPATYNSAFTYAAGATVSIMSGSTATVYRSKAGSNTGNNPATSPAWWQLIATTYPEYSSLTSYSIGDRVISTNTASATNRAYESLVNSNQNNPLDDASKWLDLGPTNRFAMFDNVNGTATVSSDNISVSMAFNSRIDGIGLFGLDAQSVQITMTTPVDGTIYNKTFTLQSDSGISNWYSYFFEPIVYERDLVVTNLPLNNGPTVSITITSASGVVQCGTCAIGQSRHLGDAVYGAQTGIQDYSRKTVDEFGNYTVVQRSFAKRAALKSVVNNENVDYIHQLLADLRATPCVWVGADTFSSTWLFGFYKDYSFQIAYPEHSYLNIELEGLT